MGAAPSLAKNTSPQPLTLKNFGPYGTFDETYNTHKILTCPAGHYISGVTGRSGPNLNKIDSAICRNMVTGALVNVNSQDNGAPANSFGSTGAENATAIQCSGTDGLIGFNLKALGEVNGMQGICRKTDGTAQYATGQMGTHLDWNSQDTCGFGSFLYQIEGGQSNHSGTHNVTHLNYGCKDLQGARILLNGGAQGKGFCESGDNATYGCAEIKGLLGGPQKDDMKAYCSQKDTVASTGCQSYYNKDRTNAEYRGLMLAYCQENNNFQNALCTDYCSAKDSSATLAKSDCDALFTAKCDPVANPTNAALPICSCLQPWTSYPGHDIIDGIAGAPQRPSCYWDTCIQNGYKPQEDTNSHCPACIQTQKITVSNATADLKNIQQSCSVNQQPAATSAPVNSSATVAPAAATTAAPTSVTQIFKSNTSWIYAVIAAIICCLIMCGAVALIAIL